MTIIYVHDDDDDDDDDNKGKYNKMKAKFIN
jgi:hypothetical protein